MSTNNPEPINDNLVTTLIKEIKSLRAELNDLRSGLETTKIQLNPKALYNNKEIRLLLGVDERLVKNTVITDCYHISVKVTSIGTWARM